MTRRFFIGAAVALAFATSAHAQSCTNASGFLTQTGPVNIGDLAVFGPTCGHLQSFSGGVTLPVINVGTINIAPTVNSLAQGINLTQNIFTASPPGATFQANQFSIADNANLAGVGANGINIHYTYGGGVSEGSRQAAQIGMFLTAPTNAANPSNQRFYVGLAVNAEADSADGGGVGTEHGSIIGVSPFCTLQAAATHMNECSAIQAIISTASGASVLQRAGIEISDASPLGGAQGSQFDGAIVVGNTLNAPGFKNGIRFDAGAAFGNAAVFSAGARAIEFVGTQSIGDIIFAPSTVTVTDAYFNLGNWVVDPSGNTQILNTSSFGWLGSFSRIFSPGDGVMELTDHTATTFSRLQLGGVTASFPAIKRNGTAINIRLADDSADAPFSALTGQFGNVAPSGNNIIQIGISTAAGRFLDVQSNTGASTREAQYGVDAGGAVYAWCVTCTGTLFGTQTTVPLAFWTNNVQRMQIAGDRTHYQFTNGGTPVLTSCGTSPSIAAGSTDAAGTVTMGTGTPTGCVITFANTYSAAPACTVSWRTSLASMAYAVSTLAITLTQTATSSDVVDYHCQGT